MTCRQAASPGHKPVHIAESRVNMPNDNPRVPTHVYGLIGALAIVTAISVIAYNKMQMAAMLENPELTQKIIASSAFKKSVEQETNDSVSAVDLQALLFEGDELKSMVSRSVSDQLIAYGSTDAFYEAVDSALAEQPKLDDNSNKLDQLRSKLDLYESQLADIAAQVNDDESAHAVNQLQGQLVELQQLIVGLNDEVHCTLSMFPRSKSSFLLKERRSTDLRGYELVVTLGRIKKDVIDSVTISAPNAERTQVNTKVVAHVTLGNPLEFQSGGHSYEGVFTYRQARFGPDFVGFEVTETPVSAEECSQTEGVAAL